MDSKQFNRIRSNAMAEASMEHRARLQTILKFQKEMDEAGSVIQTLIDNYALRGDDSALLPWDQQPEDIQAALSFMIEIIGER